MNVTFILSNDAYAPSAPAVPVAAAEAVVRKRVGCAQRRAHRAVISLGRPALLLESRMSCTELHAGMIFPSPGQSHDLYRFVISSD